MGRVNRDGSKDPIPPKMELPVTTVNNFLAVNYCQKKLQHSCHKNPGSSTDYNSINNKMFSGIFYGFIIVGIQFITAYYTYIYMYIHTYTQIYIYIHTDTYSYTYTYTYIHIQIHIHMHMYIYIQYIYVQLLTFLWNKKKNTCQL